MLSQLHRPKIKETARRVRQLELTRMKMIAATSGTSRTVQVKVTDILKVIIKMKGHRVRVTVKGQKKPTGRIGTTDRPKVVSRIEDRRTDTKTSRRRIVTKTTGHKVDPGMISHHRGQGYQT